MLLYFVYFVQWLKEFIDDGGIAALCDYAEDIQRSCCTADAKMDPLGKNAQGMLHEAIGCFKALMNNEYVPYQLCVEIKRGSLFLSLASPL